MVSPAPIAGAADRAGSIWGYCFSNSRRPFGGDQLGRVRVEVVEDKSRRVLRDELALLLEKRYRRIYTPHKPTTDIPFGGCP